MGVHSLMSREKKERDFTIDDLSNYTDLMSDFLDK